MKKKAGIAAAILVCAVLLAAVSASLMIGISGTEQPFTGKTAEYCNSLVQAGFPEDYAISLTKLHLLHPDWVFIPLQVTKTDSTYTWDHVIRKETEKPQTNLISPGAVYSAYRHPTNQTTYDSGFYQASRETVEYFMDPRNFLNECDVFQFYDLAASVPCSEEALRAVIKGTFMDGADVGNGMTYADYLIKIGSELGIDPVYLAVKLRQEQGVAGSSPIISGTCGDLLLSYYKNQTQTTSGGKPVNPPSSGVTETELLALNGYYNPFNVSATGTGVFSIYRNAMERARKGSPEHSAEWGGSPAWNTIWKGLYGGAEFIRDQYINQYQSTVYLQKFNVDGRASGNNFWKQYMQNVSGALTEARTLYQFFAANNTLDSACRFLIPVYDGMPSAPCADPAKGACSYLAAASQKYSSSAILTSPERLRAENGAVFGEASLTSNEVLTVSGQFTHSYGIKKLEYSWDGTAWTTCSENGTLDLTFSGNLPDYGEHILIIRGEANYSESDSSKKSNRTFLCAVLNVTVVPPPSVELTLRSGNASVTRTYYEGTELELPICEEESFAGWGGSDGSFLPSGAKLTLSRSVEYTALFLQLEQLNGAALSTASPTHLRFYARLPEAEYQRLNELSPGAVRLTVRVTRENEAGTTVEVSTPQRITEADGSVWYRLTADTPMLTAAEYGTRFSAEFYAELHYSNGGQKVIRASGTSPVRTAAQVARAALADKAGTYSESVLKALRIIAGNNAQTSQESLGQAFSKACGFSRQSLESPSAEGETPLIRGDVA